MKFAANKPLLVAAIAVAFCSFGSTSEADLCQCATPPGGEIQCPPGHTGFCWIDGGRIHAGCEPTPKGLTGDQLKAWVLSKALGRRIEASDVRATTSLDQAFQTGRYSDPNTGSVVTFRVSTDDTRFANNPHLGTWKLNEAKSALARGTDRNTMVNYTADGDKIRVTIDGVDNADKPMHSVWLGKFDGKAYPVEGNPDYNMIMYRVVDDLTNEITAMKGDKVVWRGTISIAPDGKSRVVTTIGSSAAGKKFKTKAIYDKQ